MAEQRTILVTGATGAQGGSVARHLLEGGKYAVRCLTRHPGSEAAAALNRAGAEVVAGDWDDIESLRRAVYGCYGVFGVTNYWEHFDKEFAQGKNLVDAVADANVDHFVFSVLPSAKKLTHGEIEVPHIEMKARLEEYARRIGIPTTYLYVAFYYENFLTYFPPQPQADGTFTIGFPQGDTPLGAVSVEDVGGVVAALLDRRDEYLDRVVGVVGDDRPPGEYAALLSEAIGKTVTYQHIPREVFASFDFPAADDLAAMFDFFRRFVPSRAADLAESRRLYSRMQTFEEWAHANRARLRQRLSL